MNCFTATSIAAAGTLFLSLGAAAQVDTMAATMDSIAKAALENDASMQYAPNRVIVKFRDDATAQDRADVYEALDMVAASDLNLIPGMQKLDTAVSSLDAMEILSQFDCVEYAEPDQVITVGATPNDPSYNLLWGMPNMNAPQAWDLRTDGSGVIVAVIDTGVDYNHGELSQSVWENPLENPADGIDNDGNGIIDDYWGADFYNNDGDPFDDNGHGTHCAGTIGAQGNNADGVAGVAWDAQIMCLKFLSGSGSGFLSDAIQCIDYAVQHGAFLSSNSWGGGGYSQALRDAIDNARQAGHLAICAAGNSANDADQLPMYPAAYTLDNIISVAAIDINDNLASFSNYGANSVDLGAPGVSIYSTLPNFSYGYLSGTSMATPHVSGLATLIWSQNPNWTYQQVRDAILNNVRQIPALNGKCTTGGTVDAYAALLGMPPVVGPGKPQNFQVQGRKRFARCTWTDASNDETGFKIQRQKNVNSTWRNKGKKIVGSNTETFDYRCRPGRYRFRLRSFNGNGQSKWTKWKKTTVNP